MEKIPPFSSYQSVLSEQLLNLINANFVDDCTLRQFNKVSSSRHLNLNNLIREHFESDPQKESTDFPIKTSNQFLT